MGTEHPAGRELGHVDSLLSYVPEALAALGALWGWRQRVQRNRALAAQAAADAARAALAERLAAVEDISGRYVKALQRSDLDAMRAIERERRERGL